MDPITLRYRSTRREVWSFYWWCWRQPQGLWRIHLGMMGFVFAAVLPVSGRSGLVQGLVVSGVVALAAVIWMPLAPLVLFKSQERTLTVDGEGLRTSIGHRSGERRWSQIMAILDRGDAIALVGKTLNGFIVPDRVFASAAERAAFLEAVRGWWRAAGGQDTGYDVEQADIERWWRKGRPDRSGRPS